MEGLHQARRAPSGEWQQLSSLRHLHQKEAGALPKVQSVILGTSLRSCWSLKGGKEAAQPQMARSRVVMLWQHLLRLMILRRMTSSWAAQLMRQMLVGSSHPRR